jgi:hypothetical protein
MPQPMEDPLLRSARREAIVVGCLWTVAMAYTVGFCATYGYGQTELKLVLGFPDWVFWGIVTPWLACTVFGIWFAYCFMSDDDVAAGALTGDESVAGRDTEETPRA